MSSNLQLFDLIMNSDLFTTIILGVLLLFSVVSWAIIFDKFFKFRYLNLKTHQFQKIFWSGQLLEDIYKKTKVGHRYVIANLFNIAMQEWENANVIDIVQNKDERKKENLKQRIYDLTTIALNKSVIRLKYGLNFLLVVASSSSLIGLLGTVWGLMHAFQALAQNVAMSVAAPNIISALTTTLACLFAAIPSLIAYYIYMNKLKTFETEMDNFNLELLNILSKELE